jgi:hypothetical protein
MWIISPACLTALRDRQTRVGNRVAYWSEQRIHWQGELGDLRSMVERCGHIVTTWRSSSCTSPCWPAARLHELVKVATGLAFVETMAHSKNTFTDALS